MSILKHIPKKDRETISLLQIGTFLEYFDLMLYVHMSIVLNDIFFPKTDAQTAALLSAFAFCSTYVLRPLGALIFGHIGDKIGRRPTVIITTMIMSITCAIMANLPTYQQIGITAAWLVTMCRILQGLSSMGEIMGAEIYVTEITKPPLRYPAVALIGVAAYAGTVGALAISALVTQYMFNWRIAFWIGAGIAVVGSIARTRLRESPEFLREKKRIEIKRENRNLVLFEKDNQVTHKTLYHYFMLSCGWPLCFYLAYLYFNPILKSSFGYTSEEIILNNFLLSIYALVVLLGLSYLSYRIHPLKILKARLYGSIVVFVLMPFIIVYAHHHLIIIMLQLLILTFALSPIPAVSVLISFIPTLKRFTTATFIYALSRAVMYIITSFSLVYLTDFFGYYGLWFILLPIGYVFLKATQYFLHIENVIQSK